MTGGIQFSEGVSPPSHVTARSVGLVNVFGANPAAATIWAIRAWNSGNNERFVLLFDKNVPPDPGDIPIETFRIGKDNDANKKLANIHEKFEKGLVFLTGISVGLSDSGTVFSAAPSDAVFAVDFTPR